jgi:hypothetical protein
MLKRRFALMLHDVCLPPRCAKSPLSCPPWDESFFQPLHFNLIKAVVGGEYLQPLEKAHSADG